MGNKLQKAKERIMNIPSDYTFNEARSLLIALGYEEFNKGKTSGSRVAFVKGGNKILLHKPHPENSMKKYMVRQLVEKLEDHGEL